MLTYQEGKDYASKTNFNCMATSGKLSQGCCYDHMTLSEHALPSPNFQQVNPDFNPSSSFAKAS